MSTDPSVLRRNVRRDSANLKKRRCHNCVNPGLIGSDCCSVGGCLVRRLPLKLQRDLPFSGPYLQMMPQGLRRTASAGASFRGAEKTAND